MIICCFGGYKIGKKLGLIMRNNNADENSIDKLVNIIENFSWDVQVNVYHHFETNVRSFGGNYPFFCKSVFPYIDEN